MKTISIVGLLLALGVTFVVTSGIGRAEEASPEPSVDLLREIMLPLRELRGDPSIRIAEGPRMLGDTFPYLVAASRSASSWGSVKLAPDTLPSCLQPTTQDTGSAGPRVASEQAALEAVRMFLAGPIVANASTGERLIEAGQRLAASMEFLEAKVTTHRPEHWAPRALPVHRDGAEGTVEAWNVSLVAMELDRMLRLVHVNARVTADGVVELERSPIVDGPRTAWQTKVHGEMTDDQRRRERAKRAEAFAARRAYAAALRPARELDTFWAAGRVLQDMDDVRALFGEPDRDVGSGIHIWTYDLGDGTSVVFGGSGKRAVYVRHVRGARGGLRGFETLGTIYAGPAR